MTKEDLYGLRNYKWYSLLALLSSLLIACTENKNIINHNDVEAVRFWYIPKDIESPVPITNCGTIAKDTLLSKETTITDETTIKLYIEAINRLKPLKRTINYDLRVTSLVRFKNNKEKDLLVCISMYNGVTIVEDVLMNGDTSIVNLLNKLLYDHLSEKDWIPKFLLNKEIIDQ